MPVNMRGGKGFKKGKKGGGAGDDDNRRFVGRTAGQDYARVIRLLGNRRVLCFCNDGVERMCKIRGALCRGPKKQIIGVGDVVLYSLRDLGGGGGGDSDDDDVVVAAAGAGAGAKEIGDIIAKYDAKEFRHIRKEAGIHRLLLAAEMGGAGGAVVDDDIFDREAGAESEAEEEEEGGSGGGSSGWSRGAAVAAAAAAPDEDVDIDAI